MQAVILSIGDELALGQTVDTNAAWLSARLAERGIGTLLHLTVADDRRAIVDALKLAVRDGDLVIVTGGLGPTEDDLTRLALAELLGVELVLDDQSVKRIAGFFERRGRPMVERNKVQAMCPAGARMLDNPVGTAPGIAAEYDGVTIWSVPGVPHEMRTLYARHIEPQLPAEAGRVILSAKINTFGKGESDVAQRLGDLMARERNPKVGTTVSAGIVSVRIRSEFATIEQAQRQLDRAIDQVQTCLGEIVFGRDETTLAQALGDLLRQRGRTLATCESCTGGLVGKMLTEAAGASDFYLGGWITYANTAKARLGVPMDLLERHGAVSEPVACAMAECAAVASGADEAVSITGIAGPGGGTDHKPVGTVWMALARRDPTGAISAEAVRHMWPGDRATIRRRAALGALNMVRLALMG